MEEAILFLTQTAPRNPRPLNSKRLRAYIMLHSLFFDRLVVEDSHLINNRHLRNLIWEKEQDLANTKGTLADFSLLLEEGYLLPVIRNDFESLQQLRDEHKKLMVEDVPSRAFINYVQEKLGSQRMYYDIRDVRTMFRERALEAFSDPNNYGSGKISKTKSHFVCEYIIRQDGLLYETLQYWVKQQVQLGYFSSRDYRFIDQLASILSNTTVAISLNHNIDIPVAPVKKNTDLRVDLNGFLMGEFLTRMPAKALIYIKGSKNQGIKPLDSYEKIVSDLERFRSGQTIDLEKFYDDLIFYLSEVELIARGFLADLDKSEYIVMKRQAMDKAKVNVLVEILLSAIGLIPILGDIVGVLYLGYGSIKELQEAEHLEDYVKGYIAGRSASIERGRLPSRRKQK